LRRSRWRRCTTSTRSPRTTPSAASGASTWLSPIGAEEVAGVILGRLLADARGTYAWLHVRTRGVDAAAFYEACGLERVTGRLELTHRRRVV
jgi:hypothetical protein